MDFRAWVFTTVYNGKVQPADPIETFARFQLFAIDIIDLKDFHRFSRMLMISMDLHGFLAWVSENGKRQPAAPIETFARFQAFHRFSWISWIFMDSGDLRARMPIQPKVQPAAPIETFARFQLPAFIDSLMLAAGLLAGGWMFAPVWGNLLPL